MTTKEPKSIISCICAPSATNEIVINDTNDEISEITKKVRKKLKFNYDYIMNKLCRSQKKH